jgi:hypothetical protein
VHVIGRAFGRLVLIALVVFGVWYVIDHYHGTSKFGCQASGAVAHADNGVCPNSLAAAAGDSQWAAQRIASIPRTATTTTGLLYDPDGHETRYTSEQDSDSDAALNVGRQAGAFPSKGRPDVVDHVEVKAAAAMRAGNVTSGVLVINFPGPPCGETPTGTQPLSCSAIVPRLLPPGTTLVVWWQSVGSQPKSTTFTGGGS